MNDHSPPGQTRSELLPWWIKLVCWLFLVFLTIPALVPIMALVPTGPITTGVAGLEYVGNAGDLETVLLASLLFVHGLAAYGLLWGKSWGPTVGVCVCAIGLLVSLCALDADALLNPEPTPVGYAIVLVSLWRIRDPWAGNDDRASPAS